MAAVEAAMKRNQFLGAAAEMRPPFFMPPRGGFPRPTQNGRNCVPQDALP